MRATEALAFSMNSGGTPRAARASGWFSRISLRQTARSSSPVGRARDAENLVRVRLVGGRPRRRRARWHDPTPSGRAGRRDARRRGTPCSFGVDRAVRAGNREQRSQHQLQHRMIVGEGVAELCGVDARNRRCSRAPGRTAGRSPARRCRECGTGGGRCRFRRALPGRRIWRVWPTARPRRSRTPAVSGRAMPRPWPGRRWSWRPEEGNGEALSPPAVRRVAQCGADGGAERAAHGEPGHSSDYLAPVSHACDWHLLAILRA